MANFPYSHSVRRVFYPFHPFYLVHSHPNMAARCDMLRHSTGTALGQKSKLKRNSASLSFDFCPSGKRDRRSGLKPFLNTASIQFTCDYPRGVLARGFEVREEKAGRSLAFCMSRQRVVAGGFGRTRIFEPDGRFRSCRHSPLVAIRSILSASCTCKLRSTEMLV